MLGRFVRLFAILSREQPVEFKIGAKYMVTLDMNKVVPGKSEADARNWLMKMGFIPTAKDDVWKGAATILQRLPKAAILRSEKF